MKTRSRSFTRGCARLAVLLLALTCVAELAAEEMNFGNLLPGGASVRKSVLSMRELRYVNLVQQRTDFSCGAAAVATILNYAYGRSMTELEVIQGMLEVSDPDLVREAGFSMLDMKRYAEKLGMRARGYEVKEQVLERIKIPVIVLLDMKGYKHFVVLKKTAEERVYVGDPALGNRIMAKADFLPAWNGIVFTLVGPGFQPDTVLANPPEPLTARGLRSMHASQIPEAHLLEFGFRHADLF
jgi:predicted double-glycine peptidase